MKKRQHGKLPPRPKPAGKSAPKKSGRQRREELDARKRARAARAAVRRAEPDRVELERKLARGVIVNRDALAPIRSYSEPEFLTRGFYLNLPFTCIDCGKEEIWTAAQQKWWYEVAKGDVFTTARRCRSCRRRERDRRAETRRVHQEGLARKRKPASR
jgi:hypothetical protein